MKNNHTKKIIASMLAIGSFTSNVALAAPGEIIAHKPILVWDYHEVHYTPDGVERIKPQVTTFDTSNVKKPLNEESVPKLYGRDVKIGHDVVIDVEIKDEKDQKWFENIYKVTKVPTHTNNPDSESQIEFRKSDGKLVLSKESRPLTYNGEHKIKIYSRDGVAGFVFVHIKEKAPELRIQADFQAVVGQDILFELRDFNYGVTNPIYEVILDGRVLTGGCVDYHVVSSILRLENGGIINTEGKHTLVVKAKGFEDAKLDFLVKKQVNGYVQPSKNHDEELNQKKVAFSLENYDLDSVSSATSGSGGGGGSDIMPGKLIFDFDLVSNAYILRNLGMATLESEKVIELWETSSKESVREKGSDEFYEWAAYKNQVMKEELKGNYLSFEDYIKMDLAEKNPNRPYNVKYVLEDGLYGKTMLFSRTNDEDLPNVELIKADYGHDVIVKSDNENWINSISNIKVGGYTTLAKKEYSIENGLITVAKNRFNPGNNKLTIEAKGYADCEINFLIEKEEISLKLEREFAFGEDVVVEGFTKDYAGSLKGISINGKYLLSESAGGTSGNYKIQDGKLILFKSNFKDTSKKILKLESSRYADRELKINLIGDVPVKEDTGKILPLGLTGSMKLKEGEDLVYSIGSDLGQAQKDFKKALQGGSVEINGKSVDFTIFDEYSSNKIRIKNELLPEEDSFTMTLKATGYESKDVEVKIKKAEVKEEEPKDKDEDTEIDKGEKVKDTPILVFNKSENNILLGKVFYIDILSEDGKINEDEDYLNGEFSIYVNDEKINHMSYSIKPIGKSKAKAKLDIEGRNIRELLKDGKNTVKVVQEGYADRIVEVE